MRNRVAAGASLLLLALCVWLLCRLTPPYIDDYWYGYMFVGDSFRLSQPIESLTDIIRSQ